MVQTIRYERMSKFNSSAWSEQSGDGGNCFGIEVWMDAAKMTNMVIARFGDR